jgi:histidine triad (HIT) family protein
MADEQADVLEQQQKGCIFCQIISGKVKSRKVYEDESFFGVLDINPAAPGHVLLLPKRHVVILPQLSDAEIGSMSVVAKNLSKSLLKAFRATGTHIFIANGAVAGQRAPHFMMHIIPRRDGDGLSFVPPQNSMSESDLAAVRQRFLPKIKEAFRLTDQQVASLGMASNDPAAQRQSAHSQAPQQQAPQQQAPQSEESTVQYSVPPGHVPPGKQHSKVDFDAIEDFFKKDGMQNLRAHKGNKK